MLNNISEKLFINNMKIFIVLILILVYTGVSFPQDFSKMTGSEFCAYKKAHSPANVINFNDSPNTPRHSYDVQNYTLNLNIYNSFFSPYPHSFTASNKMTFRVDSALSSINLYAVNTSIVIDSIRKIGGSLFAYSQGPVLCNVTLDRTYSPNEIVVMQIYYHHLDVTDFAFYALNGMVFTDCEPEGARKWFPCWDKPSDKATLDLTVKVPSSVRLGSNGRLADSTLTGDTIYYHWISRDPISTYLIVMSAKVNFGLDIVYWHKLSNPLDSIPIRFYYNIGETPSVVESIIVDMCNYYSTKFVEHPFEKNGFCTLNNQFPWGGMENQTLTSFCPNCWSASLTSHEFAHQWFGDMITCGTWADVWLNEGFATYCEALWIEHTSGYALYKNTINGDASGYIGGNPGWPMYNASWVDSTPDVNTLFNYAITYEKGACVLHMLRYTLGDTVFFNCLHGYASDTINFKFKNAVTDDFAAKISQVSGQDMTWFINEWVKQPNHPVYANEYGFENIGSNLWKISFRAIQVQTNSVFHKMPIELKFSFMTGPDTTVRVMNDVNYQLFTYFPFNRQPTAVVFDPNNDIVLKTATLTLGINGNGISSLPTKFSLYQNEPNPFNPTTKISYDIPKDSKVKLVIYDILGKEVSTLVNDNIKAGTYSVEWNATQFPSGVYFYRLIAGSFSEVKKMLLIK
jgi:aminopeptidase N